MAGVSDILSKGAGYIEDGVEKLISGIGEGNLMKSNEVINSVGRNGWWDRGITGVVRGVQNNELDFGGAVTQAFTKGVENADGTISRKLDAGTIAGSYLGVSSAYRIASGGGLYKDKNGNTNLIGVPFI